MQASKTMKAKEIEFKRSDEIAYRKPPLEAFLGEYNTLLASILADNIENFAYIASATINRMEAQTHLYEKIEKYCQLRELLLRDKQTGVIVAQEDNLIYPALKNEFKLRVKKENIKYTNLFSGIIESLKRIGILRFSVKFILVFLRSLWLIIASRRTPSSKMDYRSVIRTYFDFRCEGADGKLREEYFGPFAADLAKEGKLLVVFKLLYPKDLKLFLKLHKQQPDFESCLLETFLSPISLGRAMLRFGFSRIRLRKRYFYRGNDITDLLQRMIDDDYCGLRGIDVFIEYEAARKIMELKPKRLYFPYENQTWEKVYPLVKKDTKAVDTKIIGFQHTSFSYKLIMHFPAVAERHLPLFPDKILTVGSICQQLLKEKAHYPCDIVEGAALRHAKYGGENGFEIKVPHQKLQKRIVYAFSYDLSKYRSIIIALLDVFKESNIILFLKIHPDYNENDVLKSLQIELPENIKLAQKIPWSQIYESVDCVLYDDNTLGVEGIINGVKTFMLDVSEPIYEINRMHYFREWESSIDISGLKRLRAEIENGIFDLHYDLGNIEKYINSYFNVYSREKYFAAYL